MCHSVLVVEVGEVRSMGTPEGVLHSWRDKPVTVSGTSPRVSKLGLVVGGGLGTLVGQGEGLAQGQRLNTVWLHEVRPV